MIAKKDIFATPVYSGSIENFEAVNKVIIEKLYKQKEKDKGIQKSNILGWHSNYNLHIDAEFQVIPEFKFLQSSLHQAANSIIKAMGYDIRLIYTALWGNISPKYSNNQIHDHPPAILSGVYYLKIPQPFSKIVLYDPRPVKAFVSKGLVPKGKIIQNEYTVTSFEVEPVEGNFMFFPGWLKHSVEVNYSEEDRISMSFNFFLDQIQ